MRRVRSVLANERGDIVLGWLTRLAVVFGLAGIVLFDGISVAVTTVNVADQANTAALDASDTWNTTKNVQLTYLAALASAQKQDPGNAVDTTTFRVDPDGKVHVRLTRTATTLVLYRIGPAKKWAVVTQDGDGKSVPG
ncbi:MAG: hypothetical protein QOJ90_321 [Actinomycetota bacterium]|jgi:hypothetical protein|nr:hypothetical protein [Actinomycetota bacterium]